jgi:hypothetical protein
LGFLSSSAPLERTGYTPEVSTPRSHSRRPRFRTAFASILPVHPSRACFIPEALLRFALQGVPLEQRLDGFRRRVPFLPLPRWPPRPPSCAPRTPGRSLVRLQGFALCSSPFAVCRPVKSSARPFPSWVWSSLRFCLPARMGSVRLHLPCAWRPSALASRRLLRSEVCFLTASFNLLRD